MTDKAQKMTAEQLAEIVRAAERDGPFSQRLALLAHIRALEQELAQKAIDIEALESNLFGAERQAEAAGQEAEGMRKALIVVKEELVFGGDWENAKRIADAALEPKP